MFTRIQNEEKLYFLPSSALRLKKKKKKLLSRLEKAREFSGKAKRNGAEERRIFFS